MDTFRINLDRNFALAKQNSIKSTAYYQMGAVIVKKRPLSAGYNINKTHPVYANGTDAYTVHAEMHALIKCRADTKGASIYVYREDASGKPAIAKPCKYCMAHIIEAGIRRVYYTIPFEPYYKILEI